MAASEPEVAEYPTVASPGRQGAGRLSPYLSELDFYNSPVWNIEFDELDF